MLLLAPSQFALCSVRAASLGCFCQCPIPTPSAGPDQAATYTVICSRSSFNHHELGLDFFLLKLSF